MMRSDPFNHSAMCPYRTEVLIKKKQKNNCMSVLLNIATCRGIHFLMMVNIDILGVAFGCHQVEELKISVSRIPYAVFIWL